MKKRCSGLVALLALVLRRRAEAPPTTRATPASRRRRPALANAGPGFDGTTIKLGVLTPLTGPVAVIGKPLTAGNEVYFDYVNAEGGIAGKYKVELGPGGHAVHAADRPSSSTTRSRTTSWRSRRCSAPRRRSPSCRSSRRTRSSPRPRRSTPFWVREPNLLPVGGPYQIQAINALDYYVNQADGKGKNICSFIQDDAYGEAGQEGVDFAAEKLGFEVVDTQKFKVGDKDVTGQVAAPRRAPSATRCSSSPRRPTRARSGARPPSSASRRAGSASRRRGSTSSAPRRWPSTSSRRRGSSPRAPSGATQVPGHDGDGRPASRSSSPTRSPTTTSRSATSRAGP